MASGAIPTAPSRDSERGGAALIVMDVINCFDFAGGERLREQALRIVEPILALRKAADAIGAPTIYVNDNFGEWHSEKSKLVARARQGGGNFVERLAPRGNDYFVIKPQFSGFYATNLQLLLPKLGVSRLVMTGVAADICVLFTAADAHMRDYALWVPEDAVAAQEQESAAAALAIMRSHLGAAIQATTALDLPGWMASLDKRGIR